MQINALMSAYSLYAPASLGAAGRTAQPASTETAGKSKPAPPTITDTVSFSGEAAAQLEALAKGTGGATVAQGAQRPQGPPPPKSAGSNSEVTESEPASAADSELSPEEEKQVDELSARDREVRQHEQAHLAVAGPYARGGPTYSYQSGPDGKQYAIGGEVKIDTSPIEGDPEATAQKARVVRAAALAPAEPSGQDLSVAASATKLEQEALAEIRQNSAAANQPGSASSANEPTQAAASPTYASQNVASINAAYGVNAPEQPRFLNVVA